MRLLCFLLLCSVAIGAKSQKIDNIIVGTYNGSVFSLVDSIGDYNIFKKNASSSLSDGKKVKSPTFYVNIAKGVKFIKSSSNKNWNMYIFSNANQESMIIVEFVENKKPKALSGKHLEEISDWNKDKYYGVNITEQYLLLYYNVESQNNGKFYNSILSIRNKK